MVGGIHYNDKKAADFLYNNSLIALNIIHSAQKFNCQKELWMQGTPVEKLAHLHYLGTHDYSYLISKDAAS